jgi:hypothetical protein
MGFDETRGRAMRERLTEMLAEQTQIAIQQAQLSHRAMAMVAELADVERKGPNPAGPARVLVMRAAG